LSVDFDDIGFRNSGGLSIGFHERPPERQVTNSLIGQLND
jgi:hypothetical protein